MQFHCFTTSVVPNILISVPTKKVKEPLSVTHPELAKEADGWDPSEVIVYSSTKLDWKCSKGHKWTAPSSDRLKGQGCAVCAGRQIQIGVNDFKSTHPHLSEYADNWDPSLFSAGSNRRLNWICPLGHKWSASLNSVTSNKHRIKIPCPYCLNQKVLIGFNDLQTKFPELAKEAFQWNPSTVVFGSNKKKQWMCKEGHIWEAVIVSRSGSQKSGCPYCANQKVWPGFNDLATINPELAMEADGWDPTQITGRANKKLNWVCKRGHRWQALLSNRGKGVGCPYCANQRVLTGFNDLQSQFPSIAAEAHDWDPATVVSRSSRNREWKCSLGHIYSAKPDRRIAGDGCSICSSHQLLKGFNDLATLFPQIAGEAFEWDPSTLMSQSNKPRKWRCSEGHIWKTAPGVRVKGIGCPSCAKTGFDPNKDGYLYLLEQEDWDMYQIGITNVPDIRLGKHKRLQWKLIELRGPMDGYLTQQWETAILRMLKAKGADLSNDKIAGKFDGYSEAWSKSTFEVRTIKELMRLTEEFEEK